MKALLLIAGVTTLLLIGRFFILQKLTSQSFSQPLEKIRIGNIGEYSLFNLIAKDKGFFAKHGLDAEIHEYESGPPSVAALLAGEVDVTVAAEFVGVRSIFSNKNLRILTQASKHKVFQMIARKDKGINLSSDLKHKKIGVTRTSAGEFYLGRFLAFQGLKLSDVTIIDLPPSEIIYQIENGILDAAVIFDPHAFTLKQKLGDNLLVWSAQGDQKTFALSYSTAEFIQSHPDSIKRYVAAILEAEQYLKENQEYGKNALITLLSYTPEYTNYMWPNFTFMHSLDQELLLTMEDQARWVIDKKLTDKTTIPNYLDFIYFNALEEINPSLVTIFHE